jgi:hypothetical protein
LNLACDANLTLARVCLTPDKTVQLRHRRGKMNEYTQSGSMGSRPRSLRAALALAGSLTSVFRKLSRRARLASAAGLMVLISVAGVTATAGPASASSGWCTTYGPVKIAGVTLPTGVYCFAVMGNGLHVSYTTGELDTGWIMNYREVVRFYDNSGNNYATFWGPVHSGYAYGDHAWNTNINGTARPGRVCGILMSSGTEVTSICRSVYS